MKANNLKLEKIDNGTYKLSKRTGNTWNFLYLTQEELRMIGASKFANVEEISETVAEDT